MSRSNTPLRRGSNPKAVLAAFIEEDAHPGVYEMEGGAEVFLGPVMEGPARPYREATLKRPGVRYELRMELHGSQWAKTAFVQRYARSEGDGVDEERAFDPQNLPRMHLSAVPGQPNSQTFDEGTGRSFDGRSEFERHYERNGLVHMSKADAEYQQRRASAADAARRQARASGLQRAEDILRSRPGGAEALARISAKANMPRVTNVRPYLCGDHGERLPPTEATVGR